MSTTTNIFKISLAYATSSINQILIQIITVPIFVLKTDFATFATWIIAYNFALFTTVLDFGQVTASQNSFRILTVQDLRHQISERTRYLNTFNVLTYISYFAAINVVNNLLQLNMSMFLCGIFIYMNLLQTIFGVFEAQARANGKPTLGIYSNNILRLSEFSGVLVGLLFLSDSLPSIAVAASLTKTAVFFSILFWQRKEYSVMTFGFSSFSYFKVCLKEGGPFLLTKMSEWLIISGVVITLNGKLSSAELVLFVASRTFFRLGWQISSIISSSYSIEITSAWAKNRLHEVNKLSRKNLMMTTYISLVGSFIYLTIGKSLFELWTRYKLPLENDLLGIGLIYSLVLSISHAQRSIFGAINRNFLTSIISVTGATLVNLIFYFSALGNSLIEVYTLLVLVDIFGLAVTLLFGRKVLGRN